MQPGPFLHTFVRDHPPGLGEGDCARMANAWVKAATGKDVAALSQQAWSDAEEAEALLGSRSLPLRTSRAMRAGGFKATRAPKEGDVAVIAAGLFVCCAVLVGGMWTFRMGAGLSAMAAPRILRVWSIR